MKIETKDIISKTELIQISPLVLAFVGDSVHTMFVRNFVVKSKLEKLNDYNKHCSHYCKAKTQSLVLDKIADILTDEEKDVVRRTRNTKTNNIAKNSNLTEYKKATCFESLIGWLYLGGQEERLNEFLNKSIED